MRKDIFWVTLFLFCLLSSLSTALGEDITADEILERADGVRGSGKRVVIDATITLIKSEKEDITAEFEILSKYQEKKTLIKFLFPPRDKGKIFLMLGDDFWIYLPNTRKPIRISPLQRLLGNASYGDIARPTYSGDYYAELLRMEESENKECFVLELKAKNKKVAYHRVIYWVQKDNFHPIKADFYAFSGKLMKTAFFEGYEYKPHLKQSTPTRLVIFDQVMRDSKTIIEYTEIEPLEIPDKLFSRDYLERVR